jgi:hypothetical protein
MKDFMRINYHATSPILLMWQGIYEEREESEFHHHETLVA